MLDTGQSLRELVSRRVTLAIGLGLLAAAASVAIVLATEDAGSGPGGIELAGAVVWRGLFYGAIDGLLLTAFPIIVVFAALSESRLRRRKRGFAAVAAIALAASLLFTATYHLGYSDFRSAKVRKPVAGDLIWAAPVIATANPIGAPIAHAGSARRRGHPQLRHGSVPAAPLTEARPSGSGAHRARLTSP